MADRDGITTENAGSVDGAGGKEDVITYETHAKLLKQRKVDLERLHELESQLADVTRKQKEAEEAELKKQGQYQELLKLRDQELETERTRLKDMQREKDYREKLYAFESKLPGRIKRPEFLAFVDADSIKLNPETNQIDESSLDNCVQSFVNKYADLIDVRSTQKLPSDAPRTFSAGKISYDEWVKLPLKEKKAKWNDVIQ